MNTTAITKALHHKALTKAAQTLLGICAGICADATINDAEITFLRTWLAENAESASQWPGDVIAQRIDKILEDGVVTADERSDLVLLLQNISGNAFSETGSVSAEPVSIPFDEEETIVFKNKAFCFTGQFCFGTRAACEKAIVLLDGIPANSVTGKIDYLVVGSMVSPDWINTSYGRKIEAAIQHKQKNKNLHIIHERAWTVALGASAQ